MCPPSAFLANVSIKANKRYIGLPDYMYMHMCMHMYMYMYICMYTNLVWAMLSN